MQEENKYVKYLGHEKIVKNRLHIGHDIKKKKKTLTER